MGKEEKNQNENLVEDSKEKEETKQTHTENKKMRLREILQKNQMITLLF